MKKSQLKYISYLLIPIVAAIIIGAVISFNNTPQLPKECDCNKFINENVLSICLEANSVDYFLYKGEPIGFQLELLQKFASEHKLSLNIITTESIEEQAQALENCEFDIIVSNIITPPKAYINFNFSNALYSSEQVLVQHKNNTIYKNLEDINNKNISVIKDSRFEENLSRLKSNIKSDNVFSIVGYDSLGEEELIHDVNAKKIEFAVVSKSMAKKMSMLLKNIDYSLVLSENHDISWGVNKTCDSLFNLINTWIEREKNNGNISYLYHKYYELPLYKTVAFLGKDKSIVYKKGNISPYDNLFKEYSSKLNWDWRLLAALAYEESHFNPMAVSKANAVGVMQMIPATAARYNISLSSSVEDQIKAGTEYLVLLQKNMRKYNTEKEEEAKFIFASYNIGSGHILDARRLAEKYGANPNIWENNVAKYLMLKSKPKYYNDSVVKHGKVRGGAAVIYVRKIEELFMNYKNLVE